MRISVQSHEYSGDPKEARNPLDWHLVQSAYVAQDQFLKLIINFDGELSCSCSDPNSIGFMFDQDQEWQGWFETEVHFIGETPEEVEALKGNQFRQIEKGQMVVVILPWTEPNDATELASWESVDTD